MTIMNLKLSMLTHTFFSLGRSSRACMKVKIEGELMTASLKFVGKKERKKKSVDGILTNKHPQLSSNKLISNRTIKFVRRADFFLLLFLDNE